MKFISFVFVFLLTIFSSLANEKPVGETIVDDKTTVESLLKVGFQVEEKYIVPPSSNDVTTFYFVLKKETFVYKDINEQITLDEVSEIIEKKSGEKLLELQNERLDSASSSIVRSIKKKDLDIEVPSDIQFQIVICKITFEKTSCFRP